MGAGGDIQAFAELEEGIMELNKHWADRRGEEGLAWLERGWECVD